jgi:hypothetical protein
MVIEKSMIISQDWNRTHGMLLSFSFEPDLSHTSILYYGKIIVQYNIQSAEESRSCYQNIVLDSERKAPRRS